MKLKVKLSLDTTEAEYMILRLSEFAENAPELVKCLIDSPHLLSKLFNVAMCDNAINGAGNIRAHLKPTDFFLKFMAALEALQGEQGIVEVLSREM